MMFRIRGRAYDTDGMIALAAGELMLLVTPDRRQVFLQSRDDHGEPVITEVDPWDVGLWADRTGHQLLHDIRVSIREHGTN